MKIMTGEAIEFGTIQLDARWAGPSSLRNREQEVQQIRWRLNLARLMMQIPVKQRGKHRVILTSRT